MTDILNARWVPPAPLDRLPPGFALLPSTEGAYWQALEALPPAARNKGWFLLGEPHDHRLCCVTGTVLPVWHLHIEHDRDVFLRGSAAITIPEYQALRADLRAYREAFTRGRDAA